MKLSKEAKIGLFVILTLAATYIVINFLRGNDFLKGSTDIYSEYENVEGLTPSGPVYIKGFNCGSITAIKYNKAKGDFLVKLNIKSDFKVPSDSKTVIYSSDILGGKAIRIDLGTSQVLAKTGDTIIGSVEPDMLTSLIGSVAPLADQIKVLLDNLNTTVDNLNDIIDQETKDDIKSIVTKIEKSALNIEYITSKVKTSTPEFTEVISNLNSLTESLNTSSVTLNESLDNIHSITSEVKEAEIKETIKTLKTLVEKMQDPNGSLGKMMTTDSLHNTINTLASDIDSLIKKIEANPKKYMKLSVF